MELLHLTSLIFFTNFIHNTWHKEYPYAWLFLLLTITSIFIHSGIFEEIDKIKAPYMQTIQTLDFQNNLILLEKFIILAIIIYGGILFWKTSRLIEVSMIPMSAFFSVVYMYCFGYFQNKYSFDPNPKVAIIAHAIIHILGCLGDHIVMYEYGKLQWMRNILQIRTFVNPFHGKG